MSLNRIRRCAAAFTILGAILPLSPLPAPTASAATGGRTLRDHHVGVARAPARRVSRISYDHTGRRVINPDADNRYVVVMSHHTSEGMHNTAAKPAVFGDDLQELLLRFPNVVLHASGHSHSNRVWRKNEQLGTGYWEIPRRR